MMIDVKLSLLKDSPRKIKNRDRVRLYIGASEILARVAVLNAEEILPGESAYAQLRLEETTALKKDDIMVIRFYSPMETIGGAIVIESNPKKHKRYNAKTMEELVLKEKGDTKDIVEKLIENTSSQFLSVYDIIKLVGYQESEVSDCVQILKIDKRIIILDDTFTIHINYYEKMKNDTLKILDKFHSTYPLRQGMLKEELKTKLSSKSKSKAIEFLLKDFHDEKLIKIDGKYVSEFKFEILLDEEDNKIKQLIEEVYYDSAFATPSIEDVLVTLPYNEEKIEQVLETMIDNELINTSNDVYLHVKRYNEARDMLIVFVNEKGSITLAEYRDLLNTSRKYTVALLEHFDKMKITKRDGDKRLLLKENSC